MPESTTDQIVRKFKSAQERLVTQGSDLSLGSISDMVVSNAIDLSPHYQRRERWNSSTQSALIESFLLNVPVPPVYLAEDDFGKYSIVDGKQRISTITRFLTDKLKLVGLEELTELEGRTFSSLPLELQNTLRVRPFIRVITLLKQSDPKLKYEVFTRLNRGGESMTPQEIRNAAFHGPLNTAIYRIAEDSEFLRLQLKIRSDKSNAYRKMQDAEYVLRFLALRQSWNAFSGDLQGVMNLYMQKNRAKEDEFVSGEITAFEDSLRICEALWGEAAFKRPTDSGWRDQFLSGMYDAQMLAVYQLRNSDRIACGYEEMLGRRVSMLSATRALFEDASFEEAVRQATNTPSRVQRRVEGIMGVVEHVMLGV